MVLCEGEILERPGNLTRGFELWLLTARISFAHVAENALRVDPPTGPPPPHNVNWKRTVGPGRGMGATTRKIAKLAHYGLDHGW